MYFGHLAVDNVPHIKIKFHGMTVGYWANETQFKMYDLYLNVVVCYAHDVFTTILRFCFDVF